MRRIYIYFFLNSLAVPFGSAVTAQQSGSGHSSYTMNLAGTWRFAIDSLDKGISGQWFTRSLSGKIHLPGSMTTNGLGDEVGVNTKWTGGIADSSWFFKSAYARYREPGNIKIPFWLQPVKYYKGPAWYQKTVLIPSGWKDRRVEFFIERSHWQTTVWIDDRMIGRQNSLGAPDLFDLGSLTPGIYQLTVRIDNQITDVNPGPDSHSLTDHTQTNWNGMVGDLRLQARPPIYLDQVQVFPDIHRKLAEVRLLILNPGGKEVSVTVQAQAALASGGGTGLTAGGGMALTAGGGGSLPGVTRVVHLKGDSNTVTLKYPMGDHPLLWDEFHPAVYRLKVGLRLPDGQTDRNGVDFGMREFSGKGTEFTINGRLTFLRGTLNCASFPQTGYPPTDLSYWMHLFAACKGYGLNHMRFHSWCPPEAAFEAADRTGFYLQIECSSWANSGTSIGDGTPLDQYIYDESRRIVAAFGNHPSFCMLAYGNEPAGDHLVAYLTRFVKYWEQQDKRRLYTTAAGWPIVAENNYNSTPDPRIQGWGQGLKSILNGEPPRSDYDWSGIIAKWQHPTVSHEIGQWCVYPDFKEMNQYTGVLKAKNFEIFRDTLNANGLGRLADSFLLASGKLQVLCYKADIEAALRTKGFGGFQLLGLNDFPGQGTALVGVLNPFWGNKGYISGPGYRQFCDSMVPLVRLPKMVWLNNETLSVPVEVAHFGSTPLRDVLPAWEIRDETGKVVFGGKLAQTTIPVGNGFRLGEIRQALSAITRPSRLTLAVSVGGKINNWNIFVYPAVLSLPDDKIVVTQSIDTAMLALSKGRKVLLTLKKGMVKTDKGGAVAVGFSSIFWNTAWTNGQPPHTLGVLCDPRHPALKMFPTEYHSDWQWWDGMSHSNVILLDSVGKGLQPIVRVIDDWVSARSLGLIFECAVGQGKLVVSGIDLLTDQGARPEARQLLYSLRKYMGGASFAPERQVGEQRIRGLVE